MLFIDEVPKVLGSLQKTELFEQTVDAPVSSAHGPVATGR